MLKEGVKGQRILPQLRTASKSLSFDAQMQIRSLCLNNYNNIITKPYGTSMVADDVR